MLREIAPGPCPVPPDRLNLAEYVLAAGLRDPDKIALAIVGPARAERWSYARLTQAVADMAEWLRRGPVPPGGRILLRIGNNAGFPVAFLGAIAAGRVPVPTASALTGAETSAQARQLQPDMILADCETVLPDHPAPVAYTDDVPATGAAPIYADTGSNDPAYIIFTSGSSGMPRGVIHAHRAIWARRMMHLDWYELARDDRVMHAGAFNWTYTLGTGLLDPWTVGATALVPAPGVEVEQLPLLIARHDVSIFAAVPGVFRKLLRTERWHRTPGLRHALSAGEKLPEPLRDGWREMTGTDIHEAFGMSECSTFVSGSPGHPAPPGTLGFPQTGRRLALLASEEGSHDNDGPKRLAIHRSDPGLMLGYMDDPGAEDRHRHGDWFVTGDLVTTDARCALHYHGRADDLITAGGFRISPIEIERAMMDHPDIIEAAAIPWTVDTETTVVGLFYVAAAPVDEASLKSHAAQTLAPFKRPRHFVKAETLPRSANGKLLRRMLKRADFERSDDQA